MKVGGNTFIKIVNGQGKTSSLPVRFLVALKETGRHDIFNTEGERLTIQDLGIQDAVEIQVTGPIPRSVNKTEVHLVVGPEVMIQGSRARDLRGRGQPKGNPGDRLRSTEGDAPVRKVRGHSSKSTFQDHMFEVNATGDIHGIYIEDNIDTGEQNGTG